MRALGKEDNTKKGMEWANTKNLLFQDDKFIFDPAVNRSNIIIYVIQKQILVLQQHYGLSCGFAT